MNSFPSLYHFFLKHTLEVDIYTNFCKLIFDMYNKNYMVRKTKENVQLFLSRLEGNKWHLYPAAICCRASGQKCVPVILDLLFT